MLRKWILASAISLALSPPSAAALGLGELRTDSALNEPFVAEIELIDVKPDELDTVKASLASEAEFEKVGTERFFYLTKLRFNAQISPEGRPILRVTSREPIREPFLDFVVEVNWPEGRLVREYTVLLDPPTARDRRARPQIRPTEMPATRGRAAGRSAMTPQASMPAQVPASAGAIDFPLRTDPVPAGAGLLRMARGLAPPGATVPQTTLALYRNNRQAFVGGDINQLRVGQTLVIPSAEELFALDAQTARRTLAAALRGEPVANAPLTEPPAPVPEQGETGQLRIAAAPPQAEAADPAVGGEPDAPPAAGQGGEAIAEELLLLREASESTRQETQELRERIRELEAQLGDIRDLLALRNEQLAELQLAQAIEAETRTDVEPSQPPAEPERPAEPAAEPGGPPEPAGVDQRDPASEAAVAAEDPVALEESVEAAPEVQPQLQAPEAAGAAPEAEVAGGGEEAPEVAPEVLTEPEAEPETAAPPQGSPEPETAPDTGQEATAEPEPVVDERQAGQPQDDAAMPQPDAAPSQPEQAPAAGAADGGGGVWPWVAIGAGLAALFGAMAWYLMRRRRRLEASLHADRGLTSAQGSTEEALETGPPSATDTTPPAQRAEAPEAEAPVATAESEVRPFDSETEVDVFSEADIYIAYGRYREAEALLKEEIHRDPERLDLQLKLAEALFGMKKYEAFDGLLEQLRSAGAEGENPEYWRRLVAMQAALQESSTTSGAASDSAAAERPAGGDADEDLLGESFTEPDVEQAPTEPSVGDAGRAAYGGAAEASYLDMDLDLDTLTTSTSSRSAADMEQVPYRHASLQEEEQAGDLESEFDIDLGELGFGRPGAGETGGGEHGLPGRGDEESSAASGPASDPFDLRGDAGGDDDFASASWQQDSGLWDEVATKLDLARAYLEMRDGEAARVILEEVAEEGNDAQRAEAKQLLEQLD